MIACLVVCRQTFGKLFKTTPDELDMHVIYDVSHNIAKVEEHMIKVRSSDLCFSVLSVMDRHCAVCYTGTG